ncbi:MAG TPA: hypothetical protein VF625_03200 [Longimicrobium sp.]|jgi:hypothetical protein
MKRMAMNLMAFAVIAAGSSMLAGNANATESIAPVGGNTCTAGNGASCSGVNCCADATACWANCP